MKQRPKHITDHDLLCRQEEGKLPAPKKLHIPQFELDNKLFLLYLDIIKQK
jgi:hypothetical protein